MDNKPEIHSSGVMWCSVCTQLRHFYFQGDYKTWKMEWNMEQKMDME